jgi:hypothetical protein
MKSTQWLEGAVEVRKRLGRILDTHHLKEVRKRG